MPRRSFSIKRRQEPVPFLLLTPFIDVLLVLVCFILSISFHIQFAVDVNLPEAQTGKMILEQALSVAVNRDGSLVFQGKSIGVESLSPLLLQALKKLPSEQRPSVLIEGDEEIPYALLIQVMDVLRSQGVTDISLVTRNSRGP